MQEHVTDIVWIIYGSSAILFLFCIAYVFVVLYSHRQRLQLQNEKMVEVQRSEEKYKALFHHALAGMIKFNYRTLDVLDANEALCEMLCCPTIEDVHRFLLRLTQAHRFIQDTLEIDGVVHGYELSFIENTGNTRWMLFSGRAEPEGDVAHGVFWDITDRKLSEEKIKEQAALLNQTQDSVIVVSMDGDILFWNNAAVDMYGWTANEVKGKTIESVLYDPGQLDEYQLCREDVLQFGEWAGEQKQVMKNRKVILVESNWKRIENQFSKASTFLIVNTDITEKRALEKSSLYTQKMEGIALMTSGIAHDLQNILAPISLSIALLREGLVDPTKGHIIDSIEESTENGLKLLKSILMVGRSVKGAKTPIDLVATLESAIRLFTHGQPAGVVIVKEFGVRECAMLGDESLVCQIFLNLFKNAKDAMPHGGTITVRLSSMSERDIADEIEIERNAEEYAVVEVADTGTGIPQEFLEKIFEPFFTTKEGVGGTGLGLPIVKDLVRIHGGAITVSSAKPCGTTFTIILPIR